MASPIIWGQRAKNLSRKPFQWAGFEDLAVDPVDNLFTGRAYFNTANKTYRLYDGTTWLDIVRIGAVVESSTAGSIFFADATSKIAQDNAELFWDYVNKRLGVGTAAPLAKIGLTEVNNGAIALRAAVTGTGASAAYFVDANAANAAEAIYLVKLGTGALINALANGTGVGLILGGTSTAARLVLQGSTSGQVSINVPAAVTSYNMTLPAADGAVNQVLATDGSGNLSFVPPATGFSPYTKRVGPGEAYTTLAAVAAAAVAGDWILVTGNTTDTADVDFSAEDLVIEWSPGAVSSFTGVAHVSCLQISGNRCKLMKPYVYFQQTNNVTDCLLISATDSVHVVAGTFVIDTGSTTVTNAIRLTQSYGLISAAFQNVGSATITNLVTDSGVNNVQVVGP